MHLASLHTNDRIVPAIVDPARGALPVDALLPGYSGDVMDFLVDLKRDETIARAADAPQKLFVPADAARFSAPYRRPGKLIGIGLNYSAHAGDLSAPVPDSPAWFIKGSHTIIGPQEEIVLPPESQRVTAEAELGLVIGRTCYRVGEDQALDHVYGVCSILDQTAEDILQRNPRFLTMSKNFPTFFAFGPVIVPLAEFTATQALEEVRVTTIRNGEEIRFNTVSSMMHSPRFLVSFLSHVMPLFPGDVISTGTPGAAIVSADDVVECRISGLPTLTNTVVGGPFASRWSNQG